MTALVLLICMLVVAGLGARLFILGLEERDVWCIAIYRGPDALHFYPPSSQPGKPVLQASDIHDAKSEFVADPFMWREGEQWWMFLEIYNARARRGEIGVAVSPDGVSWTYDRTILREPFHLSYPYVFRDADVLYMIPESSQAGEVRLYRCVDFPHDWRFERAILAGKHLDPSIFRVGDHWWLLSQTNRCDLALHHSDHVRGPWVEHPLSPVVRNDVGTTRPGGKVLQLPGRIIRFGQDCTLTYGRCLRAFEIEELTTETYRERELPESPILAASGSGWNADGMHHLDAHEIAPGAWMAAVDGKQIRKRFNWRLGARRFFMIDSSGGTSRRNV